MSDEHALKGLVEKAKEIANQARSLSSTRREPRDDLQPGAEDSPLVLAHYTSLEAIIAMLQDPKGGFKLFDSFTMNDVDEGRATSDGRALSRFLREELGESSWASRRYGSANICCLVGIPRNQEQKVDPGDDLLYWRLYGDECRGVSITIAPHVTESLVKEFTVQEVIYSDEPPLQIDLPSIATLLQEVDKLRGAALDAELWCEAYPHVLPNLDYVMGERFLQKRSHYSMEREYRAVLFATGGDTDEPENSRFSARGLHVQYGLIRNYVQIAELSCKRILSTNSQITIGSNVRESETANRVIKSMLESSGISPNVVRVRTSEIPYRSRKT